MIKLKPHPRYLLIILLTMLIIASLGIARIYFFFTYFSFFNKVKLSEIFQAFLTGLRFDLSTMISVSGIPFLLIALPISLARKKGYYYGILLVLLIIWVMLFAVLMIDIHFYSHCGRRLCFEILTVRNDIGSVANIIFLDYFREICIYILFSLLFFIVYYLIIKKLFPLCARHKNKIILELMYLFVFIFCSIVALRGGFQLKPLRTSFAFQNEKIVLGHLSLNGIYTTLNTLWKHSHSSRSQPINQYMNPGEAESIVRELVKSPGEKFIDQNYPVLKNTGGNERENHLNVVIFLMESWTGNQVGALGGKLNITPEFDSLSAHGLLFENFYAQAQRSSEGVTACLGALPSLLGEPIISGGVTEQNSFRFLPEILKEKGYKTLFIHGARLGSMGFDAFSRLSGFEKFISMEDFENHEKIYDGTWGIYDEYVFQKAHKEFLNIDGPFFALIFSLTSHAPYQVPSKKFEVVDESIPLYYFLNTLYYSDYSLGKFFRTACNASYFNNTLFIILADHTEGHFPDQSMIDLFRIPCLFYCPAILTPAKDVRVASQLDIMPSIVELLHLHTTFAPLGQSLFSIPSNKKFAFLSQGEIAAWVRGSFILVNNYSASIGLYDYFKDPAMKTNLLNIMQKDASWMENELYAYVQLSQTLILKNKLYPSPAGLP